MEKVDHIIKVRGAKFEYGFFYTVDACNVLPGMVVEADTIEVFKWLLDRTLSLELMRYDAEEYILHSILPFALPIGLEFDVIVFICSII